MTDWRITIEEIRPDGSTGSRAHFAKLTCGRVLDVDHTNDDPDDDNANWGTLIRIRGKE